MNCPCPINFEVRPGCVVLTPSCGTLGATGVTGATGAGLTGFADSSVFSTQTLAPGQISTQRTIIVTGTYISGGVSIDATGPTGPTAAIYSSFGVGSSHTGQIINLGSTTQTITFRVYARSTVP